MDTYRLNAACARHRDWAERSLKLECQIVEQLTHSNEALSRSRDALNQTSPIVARSPFGNVHRQTPAKARGTK
jgi:hypothetical protein